MAGWCDVDTTAAPSPDTLAAPRCGGGVMLEMRDLCERCERPLAHDDRAVICSYECTFCLDCNDGELRGRCPNCGGDLQTRPMRGVAAAESVAAVPS